MRTIHGSTVDRLPLIDMAKFPIRVPKDLNEQRVIARILGALDDKIWNNVLENRTLSTLRDTLLPKLISGELRLQEAETLVERVA